MRRAKDVVKDRLTGGALKTVVSEVEDGITLYGRSRNDNEVMELVVRDMLYSSLGALIRSEVDEAVKAAMQSVVRGVAYQELRDAIKASIGYVMIVDPPTYARRLNAALRKARDAEMEAVRHLERAKDLECQARGRLESTEPRRRRPATKTGKR